jgi:hypothetical protein
VIKKGFLFVLVLVACAGIVSAIDFQHGTITETKLVDGYLYTSFENTGNVPLYNVSNYVSGNDVVGNNFVASSLNVVPVMNTGENTTFIAAINKSDLDIRILISGILISGILVDNVTLTVDTYSPSDVRVQDKVPQMGVEIYGVIIGCVIFTIALMMWIRIKE